MDTKQLEEFTVNLNYCIEDAFLEEKGVNVYLCLDTSDVRYAVLGMYDYYPIGKDNRHVKEDFSNHGLYDKTLVRCLASGGWLGKFSMLPPHQQEFGHLLEGHFGLNDVPITTKFPRKIAGEFAKEVASVMALEVPEMPDSDEDRLLKAIKAFMSEASTYFKVVHNLTSHWAARLMKLTGEGVLSFDSIDDTDLGKLLEDSHYKRIKQAYDAHRPDYSLNNVRDALALTILIRQVRQFKERQSRLFLMYVPTKSLFWKIVDEADIADELRYESSTGQKISILRDESYFITRASLRPQAFNPLHSSIATDHKVPIKEIERVRDMVATHIHNEKLQDLENSEAFGLPLPLLMEEFRSSRFLSEIWASYCSEVDVQQALKELDSLPELEEAHAIVEAGAQAGTPPFRDGLELLKQQIAHNTEPYEKVARLWNATENAVLKLRKKLPKSFDPYTSDFLRNLGLWQFGFRKNQELSDTLRNIVTDLENSAGSVSARVVIARLYLEADPCGQDMKRWEDSLLLASCVLRAIQANEELADMLRKIQEKRELPHWSYKALYAAALYDSQRYQPDSDVADAVRVIRELEDQLDSATVHVADRPDLMIILGYLYYRLFRCQQSALMPEESDSDEALKSINHAVSYSHQAIEFMRRDRAKQIYTVNNQLYYMVERADYYHSIGVEDPTSSENANTMERLAEELKKVAGAGFWQYRYDETLARYYSYLAMNQPEGSNGRRSQLKTAKHFAQKAVDECPGDGITIATIQDVDTKLSIENDRVPLKRKKLSNP